MLVSATRRAPKTPGNRQVRDNCATAFGLAVGRWEPYGVITANRWRGGALTPPAVAKES